ncbi:hypothetical protein M1116_01475 [Patescibacteria group bacterium]|nr:hypothetical protein [Patescibacteria group bacterium]
MDYIGFGGSSFSNIFRIDFIFSTTDTEGGGAKSSGENADGSGDADSRC